MSTNYYLLKKNNRKTRQEIQTYLEENKYDEAQEVIHDMTKGIHLYQRASGWKCAIDYHNGRYFEKSIESFIKFIDDSIATGDWILMNEYGTEFPDTTEVKDDIEGFSKGWSGADYDKIHPDPYYKCGDEEEVVDGKVRFVFYEDFC